MGLVAILTDFGTRDAYVGIMQGVILGRAPQTRFVSLTQDVPFADIQHGAYQLWAAVPYFPAGTVFLAVVDPGVGSVDRRPIAVESHGRLFVGPDNGLLSLAFAGHSQPYLAVELIHAAHRLEPTSQTFHGRDIFAPAAAHLAEGGALAELGPAVSPVMLTEPLLHLSSEEPVGQVLAIDHFGNVITTLREQTLRRFQRQHPSEEVVVEAHERHYRLVRTFADLPEKSIGAVVGSTGLIEIVANRESAAERLGLHRGTRVRLST